MEQDEFEHYVRLIVEQPLDSAMAKVFLLSCVNNIDKDNGIDIQDDDVIMVYHIMEESHCYDVPLIRHITEFEGDRISASLDTDLDVDWDFESTMDLTEEMKTSIR